MNKILDRTPTQIPSPARAKGAIWRENTTGDLYILGRQPLSLLFLAVNLASGQTWGEATGSFERAVMGLTYITNKAHITIDDEEGEL